MDLGSGERGGELLQAQAHVWNHTLNFINSAALKCAVQLRIPDVILNHGRPMTLSQLATALSVQPTKKQCLYRLMRLLIHSGFFVQQKLHQNEQEEEEEEGYALTYASRFLLKDELISGVPLLLLQVDPFVMKPFHFLSSWLQNSDPTPFHTVYGKSFYEYVGNEPKISNLFNEAMANDSRLIAGELVKECEEVFEGLTSLVDVAGGTGTTGKAIAKAFPHLKCTVLDQPHVVESLQGAENLEFVGGDMFQSIPPANAVLLKWILCDWSDEECVKILKNCREAIPSREKGGKVIILDMVMGKAKGDDEAAETELFYDMLMMVVLKGGQRNEKEWETLFSAAGFTQHKIISTLGSRSLIEVYP